MSRPIAILMILGMAKKHIPNASRKEAIKSTIEVSRVISSYCGTKVNNYIEIIII